MIEHAFANPKKLEQIQAAQKAKLENRKRGGLEDSSFVNITTPINETQALGVNKTLINLIPQISNLSHLQQHTAQYRQDFSRGNNLQ